MIVEASTAAADLVNLWGALGCAVAYSASLLATLDAFADLILARGDAPPGHLSPGIGLKFGSKIAAAAIAVVSAGIVLALDANWFAFTALSIAFLVVVGTGVLVLVRHARRLRALLDDASDWVTPEEGRGHEPHRIADAR